MLENFSILAVDDEPFNLDLIEAAFSEYTNIKITNATDGEDALSKLDAEEFDVILLDISMPVMDGLEVLQRVRKNPKLRQLPILMVTANAEKESEALELGASDFIAKPYDIEVLCARTLNYAKLNRYYKQVENQTTILENQVKLRTQELQDALELSKQTEYEISIRLGRASEFRDQETGGHIKRMSHYSEILAKLYGLSDEECELILYAAPLHDIGKIGIRDEILLKPGKLTKEEFEKIKEHPDIEIEVYESANDVLGLDISSYDLILSDIDMPEINGFELHNKLREEYNFQKPIIAVTALAVTGDKEKMLMHGFNDYISKPIDMNVLETTLQKYI